MPFTEIVEALSGYFDFLDKRRSSIGNNQQPPPATWRENIWKEFPVSDILQQIHRDSDGEVTPSFSATSQSIRFTPNQRHMAYSMSFDELNLDQNEKELATINNLTPLDKLNGFHEIATMYSDHYDMIHQLQASMTSANHEQHPLSPFSHLYETEGTANKRFTFSTDWTHLAMASGPTPLAHPPSYSTSTPFFESRKSVIEARSHHRDSDLDQFAMDCELQQHTAMLLHDGLCNRLDINELCIEREDSLLSLEHELHEIDYAEHKPAHRQQKHHPYQQWITSQPELIHSPMRQLKAKGKSAVNHIRDRTRRLTQQMTVRNMPSLPNVPSAIHRRTKQGFQETKKKFQTVTHKMLEQTRTQRYMMMNKLRGKQEEVKTLDIAIDHIGIDMEDAFIDTEPEGYDAPRQQLLCMDHAVQTDHEQSEDSLMSTESHSRSRGSIATI